MMQIQAGDRFGQLEMKDRTLDFEYEMEFKRGRRLLELRRGQRKGNAY